MYMYLYTIPEYELKNNGLKNIHCVLLLCITDVYYYYAFLCTVYYYWVLLLLRFSLKY